MRDRAHAAGRRGRVGLSALIAALAILAIGAATAHAERGFSVRYSTNDTGNFAAASNVLLTCPTSDAACDPARRGLVPPGLTATSQKLNNNGYSMVRLDTDADPATSSSSSATLQLPAPATVLSAVLYYSGVGTSSTPGRDRILMKPPGASAYRTLQALRLDDSPYNTLYQGIVDVTDIVTAARGGAYTVANIATGVGTNRHAGWALVVAYRDPSEPLRNLTVLDGLRTIQQGQPPLSSPVTGFVTPRSGPVRTTVGAIAYDGDAGALGDSAQLDDTVLFNAANPRDNFFNSAITGRDGGPLSPRAPSYVNNLGFDAVLIAADGVLKNGATDATLRVQTKNESYAVGALFFATELFAPGIQPLKTVTDLNGPPAVPGDVLEYRIVVRNTGDAPASDVTVDDPIPAETEFVPGSLAIDGASPGALTDAADADRGELVAARPAAVIRLGEVAPGAMATAVFRARIRSPIAAGVEIRNQADVRFASGTSAEPSDPDQCKNGGWRDYPSLGFRNQGDCVSYVNHRVGNGPDAVATNPVLTRVQTPNLALNKISPPLVAGATGAWTINVRNDGQAPTVGEVVATDDFVPTLVPQSAAGPGWSCAVTGQRVQCGRSDPLPPGQSYPPITAQVFVDPAVTTPVINDVSVAGGGDGDLADNTHRIAIAAVVTPAQLSIAKVALDAAPAPGGEARFRITVHVPSGITADGVTVTDALPAGLELLSATPSQGTCSGALTCALGTIPARTSATIDVVTRATTAAAGTRVVNAATATASNAPPASTSVAVDVLPLADLALSKTASTRSPNVGAPVTFTITARNEGPSPAAGVTITDILPDGFAATSAALGGRPCRIDGRAVSCQVGDLPPGGQAQAVVSGAFARSSRGEALVNHALVSGEGTDPEPGNDTAEVPVVVGPAADLDLTKVGPARPVRVGETAAFGLFLRNLGPDAARDARIVDVLPEGLRYVSSSRDCQVTRSGGRDRVTCPIGTLAAGRLVEMTLRVRAESSLANRTVENAASASSDSLDPIASNDRGSSTLEVGTGADLRITKVGPSGKRPPGTEVPYVLTVANAGPSVARDVRVEDVSPPGLILVDATPSQGSCRVSAVDLECPLGTIPAGGSAQVVVLARSDPLAGPGPFTNIATVTSTTPDADDADNRGAAAVSLGRSPSGQDPASIDLTQTSSPGGPGDPATFTVRVTNDGGVPAPAVSLVDTAGGGPGTTVIAARTSRGACRPGRVMRCAMGTIPPGGSATVRIRVRSRGGVVRNVAAVVAGAPLASAEDASARAAARVTQAPTPEPRRSVPVTG